jgi:hypothetical protein
MVNQVVMSFHACLEDGVETIPLPDWVKRIGNQKGLFYNDARDDPCTEYLSWAVDDKDVLEDDSSNQFSPLQVINGNQTCFRLSFRIRNGAHACEQDHWVNQGSLNF